MSIFDNVGSGGTAGGTVTVTEERYTKLVDDVGQTLYIGEADAGSARSAAVWRIRRVTESGQDVDIEWADGNTDFDNIWDDRTTYTYS